MGVALSQPVTSKRLYREGNELFRVGVASMQGWRYNMEDAHTVCLALPGHAETALFAIYDGHGGDAVSRMLARDFTTVISRVRDVHDARELRRACLEMDDAVLRHVLSEDGSTAIFAVASLVGVGEYRVTVGNVGDSRVILGRYRNGQLSMIPMTHDHKPTDVKEAERIAKAGGTVQGGRVAGSLALSRAFGDRNFKVPVKHAPDKLQVVAVPDFKTTLVTASDFLFLACDGIFEGDIFTRQGVIQYLHYKLEGKSDLASILADLLEECLKRGSNDNMTAMLVQFASGQAYHSDQVEFVPGPYHEGEKHASFQKAYHEDCRQAGYTVTEAQAIYAKNGGATAYVRTATPPVPPPPPPPPPAPRAAKAMTKGKSKDKDEEGHSARGRLSALMNHVSPPRLLHRLSGRERHKGRVRDKETDDETGDESTDTDTSPDVGRRDGQDQESKEDKARDEAVRGRNGGREDGKDRPGEGKDDKDEDVEMVEGRDNDKETEKVATPSVVVSGIPEPPLSPPNKKSHRGSSRKNKKRSGSSLGTMHAESTVPVPTVVPLQLSASHGKVKSHRHRHRHTRSQSRDDGPMAPINEGHEEGLLRKVKSADVFLKDE